MRRLCHVCPLRARASRSVRLGPDDALLARLTRERARPWLAAGERNAADGDLEVILDLGLELRVPVEVRHREARMDRRRIVVLLLRRILEELVELFLRVDLARVLLAERERAVEQR